MTVDENSRRLSFLLLSNLSRKRRAQSMLGHWVLAPCQWASSLPDDAAEQVSLYNELLSWCNWFVYLFAFRERTFGCDLGEHLAKTNHQGEGTYTQPKVLSPVLTYWQFKHFSTALLSLFGILICCILTYKWCFTRSFSEEYLYLADRAIWLCSVFALLLRVDYLH